MRVHDTYYAFIAANLMILCGHDSLVPKNLIIIFDDSVLII